VLTAEVKLECVRRVNFVKSNPSKGHSIHPPLRLCCLNTTLRKPLAKVLYLIPPYFERMLEL